MDTFLEYLRQNFGIGGGANSGPTTQTGMVATGGFISDYTAGGSVYRAHIFTSSGTFDISSSIGTFGDGVEYLIVSGGGGGGGSWQGGGGDAGGIRTNLVFEHMAHIIPASPGSYTITIGAGGVGGGFPGANRGTLLDQYLQTHFGPLTVREVEVVAELT